MKNFKILSALMSVIILTSGCSSSKYASNYNGLGTPDGAATHVNTSNFAIHLLVGKQPLIGNASLEKTVDDFTAAAKATGASQVRIVQSSSTAWWFLLFPFTLLITPVTSNVAGDALK